MALYGVSFPGVTGFGAQGAPAGQQGPWVTTSSGSYGMPASGDMSTLPGYNSPDTRGGTAGTAGGGTGSSSSGSTGWAWQNLQPSKVTYPSQQLQSFGEEAKNYPQWIRALGENAAQQAYQRQVNQGIRLGQGPQAVQSAQNQLNLGRQQAFATAGQEALKVGTTLEDFLVKLYGIDVTQRGQDVDYLTSMRASAAQEQAALNREGGQTLKVGGVLKTGGGTNAVPGTYTNIYGQVSPGSNPVRGDDYWPFGKGTPIGGGGYVPASGQTNWSSGGF